MDLKLSLVSLLLSNLLSVHYEHCIIHVYGHTKGRGGSSFKTRPVNIYLKFVIHPNRVLISKCKLWNSVDILIIE